MQIRNIAMKTSPHFQNKNSNSSGFEWEFYNKKKMLQKINLILKFCKSQFFIKNFITNISSLVLYHHYHSYYIGDPFLFHRNKDPTHTDTVT